MNYRTAKVLAEKTLSGAGTETIDINVKDIISRINLSWRVVRSGEGMDSYPYDDIDKIELVDGSDVLHSMDGGENQAICIYDRRCASMNHGEHKNANSEFSLYGIDFGRFLFDPELAFDPKKFSNPQLKVTYDVDVCDTGVTEGHLEVLAECFDEKVPSPVGFLMAKEHWSGAKPTTGYEYIDLPTDYPIRKMLIKAFLAGYEPWYQVSEARIDEDNEKRIPFDWGLEDYYRFMKGFWTPIQEEFYGEGDSGATYYYYVTPTDYKSTFIGNVFTGAASCGPYNVCKGGKIRLVTSAATGHVMGYVYGYLPNHCFEFPFGDQRDMSDWYDVTKLGSLRLRLKAGTGASTTTGVVLQQLRRY